MEWTALPFWPAPGMWQTICLSQYHCWVQKTLQLLLSKRAEPAEDNPLLETITGCLEGESGAPIWEFGGKLEKNHHFFATPELRAAYSYFSWPFYQVYDPSAVPNVLPTTTAKMLIISAWFGNVWEMGQAICFSILTYVGLEKYRLGLSHIGCPISVWIWRVQI